METKKDSANLVDALVLEGFLKRKKRAAATHKRIVGSIGQLRRFLPGSLIGASPDDVAAFVDHLMDEEIGDQRTRVPGTIVKIVDDCVALYEWALTVPEFRRKVDSDILESFDLDPNLRRAAGSRTSQPNIPTLDWVFALLDGIPETTEVGRRDRCAVCLAATTGSRISALTTLPRKAIDLKRRNIVQTRSFGTKTKFGKEIWTPIMAFDQRLVEPIVTWVTELDDKKLPTTTPIFPEQLRQHADGTLSFVGGELGTEMYSSRNVVNNMIRVYCQALGLESFTVHGIRYMTVKLAKRACRNIDEWRAVSKCFGHAHLRTTDRYLNEAMDVRTALDIGSGIDYGRAVRPLPKPFDVPKMPPEERDALLIELLTDLSAFH